MDSHEGDHLADEPWRLRLDLSFIHMVYPVGYQVHFPTIKSSWRMGQIQTEKIRPHSENEGNIQEASGVCIATQVEDSSPGMKAIMKIKLQLTPWDEPEFEGISRVARREIANLTFLTERGSQCTPKLIDCLFGKQDEYGFVPGGYVVVILMEKVPGRNLKNFHTFPLDKRDRVRIAFAKALMEFRSYGLEHYDPGRHNMIWDNKQQRCFVVDVEETHNYGPQGPYFWPRVDFARWRLHSREMRGIYDHDHDDPMIPDETDETVIRDEKSLGMLLASKLETNPK